MTIKNKHLEGKGEMDYDYANDILFFKVKDREYDYSLEFGNIVVDIDLEDFITGIQLFDASKFLRIDKTNLRQIPRWKFQAKIQEGIIELRLFYQVEIRNKIIEKNPIIIQQNTSNLPEQTMGVAV
ncbi:MAG: DUF2283 domain-containing protein [Candidatus Nanoarchaeia archaeon]